MRNEALAYASALRGVFRLENIGETKNIEKTTGCLNVKHKAYTIMFKNKIKPETWPKKLMNTDIKTPFPNSDPLMSDYRDSFISVHFFH